MKDILVITHSGDFDGICSREIARRALGDTADYLGYEYGEPVPDLSPYKQVYMIDISFKPAVMARFAHKLVWIDHHQTAIEAMEGFFILGYRIDGVAACRLAWQWFEHGGLETPDLPASLLPAKEEFLSRNVVEPMAVQLLGRYDVWDKDVGGKVDAFQLGLLAEKNPDWPRLFEAIWPGVSVAMYGGCDMTGVAWDLIEAITQNGCTIQRFTEVTNADISKTRGFDVEFEGLKFRALNTAKASSLTFIGALKPEHDGCLAYFYNGKYWKISLYGVPHKPHVVLNQIAFKYGGGGHKQACGFELAELPAFLGGGQVLKAMTEETK